MDKNTFKDALDTSTEVTHNLHSYICIDADLKNPLSTKYGIRTNIFQENDKPMFLCKNPDTYGKKYCK